VSAAIVEDIEIRQLPSLRVAYVRHTGPYLECGTAWRIVLQALAEAGRLAGHPLRLGIPYDNPAVVSAAALRYDACVVVDAGYTPESPIDVRTVPGGEHAVLTYRGPYEGLAGAYATLFAWLGGSGRQPGNAPCLELYRNWPDTTPPEDLLTEICLPLRPR
jgi:AraC family transcriptional regulator